MADKKYFKIDIENSYSDIKCMFKLGELTRVVLAIFMEI